MEDLKKQILIAAYNWFHKNVNTASVRYDAFCTANNIQYDSDAQLSMAMDSLKNDGYIDITPFAGITGFVAGITAAGVNYVEAMLR